jgi:hypothetical protein
MTLAGLTNPITISTLLVKWTPATPLRLSANTCYWAVLSSDSGDAIGAISSATIPAGDARTFGITRTDDAGATWLAPDNGNNLIMLVQGTPLSTPSPIGQLTADGSTTIPDGAGNFASFPTAPSLSGDSAAFLGLGSGGQQGIYSLNRDKSVTRVADLNTAVPNGIGNFLSFGTQAGIIIVGGDVLFNGLGSGGQNGIYLLSHMIPPDPIRIADTATTIPGGLGTFTGFQNALGFSGSDVAFVGNGSGGQQGLYKVAVISAPQIGAPLRIADLTTAIPGGKGNFTAFPSGPAITESEIAFIGNGSDAQQGLYLAAVISPSQIGSLLRVADTTTAIPDGTGNFTSFGSDQAIPGDPTMSADRLAFVGSGSGGQQGVYTVAGTSTTQIGAPTRVADIATAIPGGSGNFSSFDAVSVNATDTAFLGHGSGGQTGIYDLTGGQLRKVVTVGDALQGKTIASLSFSRGGLFGDPIAFQATFSDGSQGIFTMDVAVPPSELRITAVELIGGDLWLSFTSVTGQNYAIQGRADLSSGGWTPLPGAPISGTGATVQVTLPNVLSQPQQFYSVKIVP